MKRIFICSPFRHELLSRTFAHRQYARDLCRFCIEQGHAPFASHLLYPQFLKDSDAVERSQGIQAALTFLSTCQELWFGAGFGITEGMRDEIFHANYSIGIPVREVRREADRGFVIVAETRSGRSQAD